MRFGPIRYLDWARAHIARREIRYNLAASGMPDCDLARLASGSTGDAPVLPRGELGEVAHDLTTERSPRHRLGAMYGLPPECFVAVGGTSSAIFVANATLLSPGDAIIVEQPGYESLVAVPEALGARVVRLDRPFERSFAPSWDELEAIAAAERPRVVTLTHLHNPSGVALRAADFARLAQIAEAFDLHVVLNTVYADYADGALDRIPLTSPRFVLIASLTKVYGLGYIRYGWVATANRDLAKRFGWMHDHVMVGHAATSEDLACRALERSTELRAHAAGVGRAGMRILARWVEETPGVAWVPPAGGIFAFPRMPAGTDVARLVELLESEYDTLAVPGAFFGAPGHLRIGVGAGPDVVAEGLARIGAALERVRATAA